MKSLKIFLSIRTRVTITPEIYGITENTKLYFDKIYDKYHNKTLDKILNIRIFYEEFLSKLEELEFTQNSSDLRTIKYIIEKPESKKILQDYFKQTYEKIDKQDMDIEYESKEKEIRVFSYNSIIMNIKKEKNIVIDLPSKLYWEIHFNKEFTNESVKIDGIDILIVNNVYRLPYRTDKFNIYVNEDTKIILKESKYISNKIIWEKLINTNA